MGKVAASPNGSIHRPLTAYESMVRALSDRVVEAQRPIRILDAIKWDDDVERPRTLVKAQRRQLGEAM